ncbi:MAG: hypothetical protein AB7E30_03960 [Lawsonibacter sp.]
MTYLTHTEAEYRAAVKYYKALGALAKEEPEKGMVALGLEALRYAALRMENPALTPLHLMQMHGQPVYCQGLFEVGGGIVDAKKEAVIQLDHDGVWSEPINWASVGRYFRFPLNGVDLLGPDGSN